MLNWINYYLRSLRLVVHVYETYFEKVKAQWHIVEKIVFWLLCVIFIFFTQEIWFILQNRVKSLENTRKG